MPDNTSALPDDIRESIAIANVKSVLQKKRIIAPPTIFTVGAL